VTDDISRHKPALRQKQRELRSLLREWDPIGVYGPGSDCPPDEYDCLLVMVGRLREGASPVQLEKFLFEQLKEHFGLDPAFANAGQFAQKVHRWYWADPLPGSVGSA
jgi:hypothetical protein